MYELQDQYYISALLGESVAIFDRPERSSAYEASPRTRVLKDRKEQSPRLLNQDNVHDQHSIAFDRSIDNTCSDAFLAHSVDRCVQMYTKLLKNTHDL